MSSLVERDGLKVVYCNMCGFAHLDMIKPSHVVDRVYSDGVYSRDWIAKEFSEHDKGYWKSYYQWKLDLISEFGECDRIIDVGSGLGWFNKYALDSGFSDGCLYADVEPAGDVSYLQVGSKYKWVEELGDEWLDSTVHMSLVLEHIPYPMKFLENLRKYAKTIVIVVPNEFNPLQNVFGSEHIVDEHHINYFTPESLVGLVNSVGYTVEFVGATFPVELFMFVIDYRKHKWFGPIAHRIRLFLEKLFGTRIFSAYKFLFDKFGWGREVVVVARRNG